MLKNLIIVLFLMINAGIFAQETAKKLPSEQTPALLIFTAVEDPKKAHKVTSFAAETIVQLAQNDNFMIEITDDSNIFTEQNLPGFAAIIFLNTRGNVLDEKQQSALQKYIRGGGGAAVIHAAMLAEENWEWFRALLGTQFKNHPAIQPGKLINAAPEHKVNHGLPESWMHSDEWYNYTAVPKNVTVLLNVDESTYQGGIHGENHPIAWCHEYDGGRIFYTALGHTNESWTNQLFLQHVFNGIRFVTGSLH